MQISDPNLRTVLKESAAEIAERFEGLGVVVIVIGPDGSFNYASNAQEDQVFAWITSAAAGIALQQQMQGPRIVVPELRQISIR